MIANHSIRRSDFSFDTFRSAASVSWISPAFIHRPKRRDCLVWASHAVSGPSSRLRMATHENPKAWPVVYEAYNFDRADEKRRNTLPDQLHDYSHIADTLSPTTRREIFGSK